MCECQARQIKCAVDFQRISNLGEISINAHCESIISGDCIRRADRRVIQRQGVGCGVVFRLAAVVQDVVLVFVRHLRAADPERVFDNGEHRLECVGVGHRASAASQLDPVRGLPLPAAGDGDFNRAGCAIWSGRYCCVSIYTVVIGRPVHWQKTFEYRCVSCNCRRARNYGNRVLTALL